MNIIDKDSIPPPYLPSRYIYSNGTTSTQIIL
jgi:hypothetical protein